MANLEEIKAEIMSVVKEESSFSKDLKYETISEELEIMSSTEGLGNKNNLESFYNIWKNNKGSIGHKNDINSWTAYFLGMTEVKPNGEFLPTRRAFARAGFPDIDTDFDDMNRDSVYAYIIDKYGRENVGNIGTHGKLKFKSCVTRVVKALDLANAFNMGNEEFVSANAAKASEILSPFPKKGLMKVSDGGESYIIKTFSDAYEHCVDFRSYIDKYQSTGIKKYISQTEGTFSQFGCLSKDTPILTEKGWTRIDQLTTRYGIAYIDKNEKIKYTNKFKKFKTGVKKIYRMKLSNGSFIDVTDEHLIFTDKGCVKFEEIRKNQRKYRIYGIKKGLFEE